MEDIKGSNPICDYINIEVFDTDKNKVISSEATIFELKVNYSFSPNNLWIVGLREVRDAHDDIYYEEILYRKVSQVVCGKVEYKNLFFYAQFALIHNHTCFQYLLINSSYHGHSILRNIGEYMNVGDEGVGYWLLLDYDEIKMMPEYDGLPFREVVTKVIKNEGYTNDLNFFWEGDEKFSGKWKFGRY